MRTITRREVCLGAAGVATLGSRAAAQVHASESPMPQVSPPPGARTVPSNDKPDALAPVVATGALASSRVFPYDRMPVRTNANGGESRNIVHGTLATGETVNLHQSMQPAGAAPSPLHVIQHSEFILVRAGEVEFQHEAGGQVIAERVGAGGVIYVAFGTRHAIKNVGSGPARYFVVAIGGDAK